MQVNAGSIVGPVHRSDFWQFGQGVLVVVQFESVLKGRGFTACGKTPVSYLSGYRFSDTVMFEIRCSFRGCAAKIHFFRSLFSRAVN